MVLTFNEAGPLAGTKALTPAARRRAAAENPLVIMVDQNNTGIEGIMLLLKGTRE
jgi:hypothetical protein